MNVRDIRLNIVWIWEAIHNVRSLLVKWTVTCCISGSLYVTLSFFAFADKNITYSLNPIRFIQPSSNSSLPPNIDTIKNVYIQQLAKSVEVAKPQPAPVPASPPVAVVTVKSIAFSGNAYTAGNCTWYAKSKRPDLPNTLGNANQWTVRAKAQGISTGTEPKAGAIAQQGMHVVYVEKVNSNGTIHISEMNFVGLGKISERTVAARGYSYIY